MRLHNFSMKSFSLSNTLGLQKIPNDASKKKLGVTLPDKYQEQQVAMRLYDRISFFMEDNSEVGTLLNGSGIRKLRGIKLLELLPVIFTLLFGRVNFFTVVVVVRGNYNSGKRLKGFGFVFQRRVRSIKIQASNLSLHTFLGFFRCRFHDKPLNGLERGQSTGRMKKRLLRPVLPGGYTLNFFTSVSSCTARSAKPWALNCTWPLFSPT